MLKRLRLRLTFLCTGITGAVLLVMAISTLSVSEDQLDERSMTLFQSNVNAIINKLQSDSTVSSTWLAKTEAGDRLIIGIVDNGQAFTFSGAWTPRTPRISLIERARSQAATMGIDTQTLPDTFSANQFAFFEMRGKQGERYRASVNVLTLHGGRQSITVLRDMRDEDGAIVRQRVFVLLLSLAGMGLLFLFAWWFSGRAIRPIEESQRRQTEFVAAASHELRSPLAVIRTSATALSAEPARAEQFAATIERESGRMARLVDDLLLLAGLDARTWTVCRETVDCDTLLLDAYERYTPTACVSGHLVSLDLPEDSLPTVSGDPQRLAQVLSILIDNSLQHTPAGSSIVLRGRAEAKALRIEVEDNGPGIEPQHWDKLFERFYRADKARTEKAHFGLGLSIARELTELHGGTLTLRDTPGGGATFVVRLPRSIG